MPNHATTYLSRPTVIASADDPCAKPSGLRWINTGHSWWELAVHGRYFGVAFEVHRPDGPWSAVRVGEVIHHGTLAGCARALVEAVG